MKTKSKDKKELFWKAMTRLANLFGRNEDDITFLMNKTALYWEDLRHEEARHLEAAAMILRQKCQFFPKVEDWFTVIGKLKEADREESTSWADEELEFRKRETEFRSDMEKFRLLSESERFSIQDKAKARLSSVKGLNGEMGAEFKRIIEKAYPRAFWGTVIEIYREEYLK